MPVHAGAGQGEIEQVAAKGASWCCAVGGAQAAVVRFAAGDDVLDVGLSDTGEIGAGVRAVDAVSLLGDDVGLDTLRIRIVVRVVVRAAVFRLDPEAQAVSAATPVGRWWRGPVRWWAWAGPACRWPWGRPGCFPRSESQTMSMAQVQERRIDPAALIVHAAELQPGGVKAVGAVAGDDVEPLALEARRR